MNHAKRANYLFLLVVILSILINLFATKLNSAGLELPIILNLVISQSIIFVPGLIFFVSNRGEQVIKFRKIRFLTIVMLLVFTELLMPLISAINAFSQLFTENAVVSISDQVVGMPFIVMFLIIGIIGPMSEEFVFRGIIFMGLRKSSLRPVASGLVSALFFGLMHMNINQCMYAFVLGFVFALLDDALDSIWPSVIVHCMVNSQNVILIYFVNYFLKNFGDGSSLSQMAGNGAFSKAQILLVTCIYGGIALFTTTLAALLFYAICSYEKKSERLKSMFIKNPDIPTGKVLYTPGIIGILLCVSFIFLLEPLITFLKK